jgi:hypothetical protein
MYKKVNTDAKHFNSMLLLTKITATTDRILKGDYQEMTAQ